VFALNYFNPSGSTAVGGTVLVNSNNTPVASTANSGSSDGTQPAGVITDLSFVSNNGGLALYSGDSNSLINNYLIKKGSTGILKRLNWREVPNTN
jgi:hypothetical protein